MSTRAALATTRERVGAETPHRPHAEVVGGRKPRRGHRSVGSTIGAPDPALSHRDRAILRAVDAGTAELTVGAEPDLYVDGLFCSDQFAAHRLARAGLIAADGPGPIGQRVHARLTMGGRLRLAG